MKTLTIPDDQLRTEASVYSLPGRGAVAVFGHWVPDNRVAELRDWLTSYLEART